MEEVLRSLALFQPEITLTVGLLLVVLVDSFAGAWRDGGVRVVTIASLVVALYQAVQLQLAGAEATIFSGLLTVDPLGSFFKIVLVLASLLVVGIFSFRNSRELHGLGQGEMHALVLALTLSNLLLSAANDLVMLYLALEMVSITSYVMVAYLKGDRMSNEASLKYLLFGAASTGGMLYGLSLLYGMTGTTSLPEIRDVLAIGIPGEQLGLYVATLLVVAGFGFKIAAVPFHFWCPDVYQGAATPVTALLSVAPKAAGFAIVVRFFFGTYSLPVTGAWDLAGIMDWQSLLIVLSVATMTLGNIAALTQNDMKRLLAYSSIAHAGYILMGVVALSDAGARGVLIYLFAYLFMNLGAFFVVTLVHLHDGTFDLRDYPGLYRRAPFLTVAMGFFMLSLVGIPPLVGFLGKLYVFGAVVNMGSAYYWFAAVGAVNAAIAGYYYLRVLKVMIIDAGNEEKPPLKLAFADRAWVVFLAAANLVPILFWGVIDEWAQGALTLYAGR